MERGSGIVYIHGGGAGTMIGEKMWEQLVREHGVTADGLKDDSVTFDCPAVAFQDIDNGHMRPRALFIDPDAQDLTRVRKGSLSKLWSPRSNLVTWNRDAQNLYTEGHYNLYYSVNEDIADKLRRLVEPVDSLEGFLISRSLSGGTGSGLIKRVMEDMAIQYPKRTMSEVCVFPSRRFSSIPIEPYNAVFGLATTDSCYTMLVSNEGVGEYIASAFPEKQHCAMSDINSVIGRVMCNLTCQGRMSGERGLDKLVGTAVYASRSHHLAMPSYALLQAGQSDKQGTCKRNLTKKVFERDNQLLGYPLERALSSHLSYQGDMSQVEAHGAVSSVGPAAGNKLSTNTSISSVEKIVPTSVFDKSPAPCCELAHVSINVGVRVPLRELARKYDKLYRMRAYVHWIVGCGISEESVFVEREELEGFIKQLEQRE